MDQAKVRVFYNQNNSWKKAWLQDLTADDIKKLMYGRPLVKNGRHYFGKPVFPGAMYVW